MTPPPLPLHLVPPAEARLTGVGVWLLWGVGTVALIPLPTALPWQEAQGKAESEPKGFVHLQGCLALTRTPP